MATDLTIWKFPIPIEDQFELPIPRGGTILTVRTQGANPYIWALVDPSAPTEQRWFRLAGTGHPISHAEHMRYIGTVMNYEETLVFHLFEMDVAAIQRKEGE